MQFAHFGSEPEKLPPPHPTLPYDVTAGAPHSAALALFHTIAPVRSMMPGTYCPTTPSRAYSQRCTCAAPWRRARIDPRRRTCATPCCQAPRRSQYRARSASPPLGTAPELPEAWKQKSDQNCNFFAIGNCRRCPNHGSSPENEAKRPLSASFPLYRRRERAANRKNVAKAPGFLFS